MLGSTVFDWEKLPVRPTAVGQRRDVANNPSATLATFESHITTLNPGLASHPPHRHAQEEIIVVKEGLVEAHINGTTQVAGPGSIFFFASNDAHAVRNVGDKPATYWVINLASAATHSPAELAAGMDKPKRLQSQVFDWAKLPVAPTKNGERRAFFNAPTATLTNFSVHATTVNARDALHAAHRHVDEEVVIVKEGTIEVLIEGKTWTVGPGSIAFYAPNELHGMRNVGDTSATYYVIRFVTPATPKPPPKK